MPLTMARPQKHPKTGIYWVRRVVPEALRALVGKREEKRSFGTCDPEEARRLHAQAIVEIDARWANLRAGERTLTERQAHTLVKPIFTNWLALYADDPNNQLTWHPGLYDRLVLTEAYDSADDGDDEDEDGDSVRTRQLDAIFIENMRRFAFAQAKFVLEGHGLTVDNYSYLKVVRACAIALQWASVLLAHSAETGEPVELDDPAAAPEQIKPSPTPLPNGPSFTDSGCALGHERGTKKKEPTLTLTGLFEGLWKEAKAAGRKESTHESYSHTLNNFVAFLKPDDAHRFGAEDIVAFKN